MDATIELNEIRRILMNVQNEIYDRLLDLRVATGSTEVRDLANEVWDGFEEIKKKVYAVQIIGMGTNTEIE